MILLFQNAWGCPGTFSGVAQTLFQDRSMDVCLTNFEETICTFIHLLIHLSNCYGARFPIVFIDSDFFYMVLSLAYRHTSFQAFIFFSISNFQSVKLQMFQILHLSNFQIVKRASIKNLQLHACVWLDLVCLEELAVIYPLLLYGSLWLKIKMFLVRLDLVGSSYFSPVVVALEIVA